MKTFAVTYVYTDDAATLDAQRPAHRAYLQALAVAGSVKASGPVNSGDLNGALIIVQADSSDAALALLDHDPFWVSGLIVDRAVVEWTIVIGDWANR